jgi:hypothetical protein
MALTEKGILWCQVDHQGAGGDLSKRVEGAEWLKVLFINVDREMMIIIIGIAGVSSIILAILTQAQLI